MVICKDFPWINVENSLYDFRGCYNFYLSQEMLSNFTSEIEANIDKAIEVFTILEKFPVLTPYSLLLTFHLLKRFPSDISLRAVRMIAFWLKRNNQLWLKKYQSENQELISYVFSQLCLYLQTNVKTFYPRFSLSEEEMQRLTNRCIRAICSREILPHWSSSLQENCITTIMEKIHLLDKEDIANIENFDIWLEEQVKKLSSNGSSFLTIEPEVVDGVLFLDSSISMLPEIIKEDQLILSFNQLPKSPADLARCLWWTKDQMKANKKVAWVVNKDLYWLLVLMGHLTVVTPVFASREEALSNLSKVFPQSSIRKTLTKNVWQETYRSDLEETDETIMSSDASPKPKPSNPISHDLLKMEYYSTNKVLKELQLDEDELKRLVSEGEIRAFRDEDKMKFKKSDIDGLKKGRMTEPTILLPSGDPDDSAEDSEVLLVEEDTSETLLDISDLDRDSSASVPTVDFSSDLEETFGPITEELSFEEDSSSYVLESADEEAPDEILSITEDEEFIEEDGIEVRKDEISKAEDITSIELNESSLVAFGKKVELEKKLEIEEDSASYVLDSEFDDDGDYRPHPAKEAQKMIGEDGKIVLGKIKKGQVDRKRAKVKQKKKEVDEKTKKVVAKKKKLSRLQKVSNYYHKKAKEKKIHTSELFLGDGFGSPGPTEKMLLESKIFLKGLQVTLGLKWIVLVNTWDRVLEGIAGYFHSIYRTWKLTRSAQRRLQSHKNKSEGEDLLWNWTFSEVQMGRLFLLPGFAIEDLPSSSQEKLSELQKETFPLQLALALRDDISSLQYDLNLVNFQEAKSAAAKTFWDFLKSFVPNPMEIIVPWKDLVIATLFLEYSRADVQKVHEALTTSYSKLGELVSQEGYSQDLTTIRSCLDILAKRTGACDTLTQNEISEEEKRKQTAKLVSSNRESLKRLLAILCCCEQLVYPEKWKREELLEAYQTMKSHNQLHPYIYLEMESWLRQKTRDTLQKTSHYQKKQDWKEEKNLQSNYREYRRFYRQTFLLG